MWGTTLPLPNKKSTFTRATLETPKGKQIKSVYNQVPGGKKKAKTLSTQTSKLIVTKGIELNQWSFLIK